MLDKAFHQSEGSRRIFSDSPLRREGDSRPGGVALTPSLDRDVEQGVVDRYRNSGYPVADAEIRWLYTDPRGAVKSVPNARRLYDDDIGMCQAYTSGTAVEIEAELSIYEGKKGVFGDTLLRGNFNKTSGWVLRRQFDFKQGARYNRSASDATRNNIDGLGVAESVNITPYLVGCDLDGNTGSAVNTDGEPCTVHQVVEMRERNDVSLKLSGGLGFATLDPFYLFLHPEFPNLWGTGWDFDVLGHYGFNTSGVPAGVPFLGDCAGARCYQRSVQGSLTRPRIFASPLTLSLGGTYQLRLTPARGRLESATAPSSSPTRSAPAGRPTSATSSRSATSGSWRRYRNLPDQSPCPDLNPYKPYPDSAYYVPTQSTQEHNLLLNYAEHPNIRRNVVGVFGNRGSGKTALINHWLHENNTALEGLDTFWVRCNAVHLFRLWTDREYDPTRLVTVDEYLDLQLVYVLAKYCLNEDRHFLRKLFGLLEQQAVTFDKVRSLSTPNHVDIMSVTKYLREHVNREIQQHEKKPRDSRMLQLLEPSLEDTFKDEYVAQLFAVGQETKGKERRHWSDCSKAIQEALIASGVRILWILDGVDNIHMNHDKSLSFYNRMIGEVANFVRTKPPAGYLRLACMRQKTYLDCKNSPLLPYTKEYTAIREVDHRPADEKEIVKIRLTHLFGAGQTNEAGKLLQLVNLENKAWIDKIFHGNIRNYLHNCCTLALTLKYRIEQGVTDILTQVMVQRTRNLFLNGRFYLNTRCDWHNINEEQGIAVFNPFMSRSSDLPTSLRDWEGLVRIRLLESFSRREASEPTALVRDKLICILGYRKATVDTAIIDCLAFELLEPFLVEGELRYRTTQLGEYVLRELISNIDSLYYFAHDTPVPESLLVQSFFPAHRNSFLTLSKLISSCEETRTPAPGTASGNIFAFVTALG